MDYLDGDSREGEDELRSETLSRSDDSRGAGPSKEGASSKRDRLRKVLLPAIQSRVAALGGWEEVIVPDEDNDEDDEEDESSSSDIEYEGDESKQHKHKQPKKERQIRTVRLYKLGDECLGCLKDLKRFWRMDDNDDDRNIARMFFETGILKNDLVPILASYGQLASVSGRQEKAALASADLIAAMTWPINALEELREAELNGDKATIEAMRKIDWSSLMASQRAYKSAILKSGAIGALFKMLAPRLQKGFRERTERDENVISLILHIFRNLAAIEDRRAKTTNSTETIEEANLQSDLICKLASENILDILITISSLSQKTEYNRFNTLCLEIFYLLFRGVEEAELLIRKKADVTKQIREEKLSNLLNAEKNVKRINGRKGVTRHSRFGTTVMIQNGKDRIVMHKQSSVAQAISNPGKVIDQDKKIRANRNVPTTNELSRPVELRPEALKVLQAVAMSFLESSFNPFIASLSADIRMQRAKIKEVDNVRFLFLSRFFMDYFLHLYAYERTLGLNPSDEDAHDFDLIAEMTEPSSVAYVCLRMQGALAEKPPLWTELHAGVDCFTQLLLVMDALYHSGNEDYKEVAEILQNKLYYEGETLDLVIKIASTYKNQPIRYLDTVINLVFVLLRMLEKFSKNKDYMYVKKKANKRAKRKDNPDYDGMDDEEAEYEAGQKTYSEHVFHFQKFEESFANHAVMHTLLTYLMFYKEFSDEEQMKRVVNLLHRIAVKANAPQLFYKASTLDLFKRIWDDKPCLPKTGAYKDLDKLVTFVVKEFFKAAKEYPLMFIEIFFKSGKMEVMRAMKGEDSESEDDFFGKSKKLKVPQEIIVKKKLGLSWSQEVGVAVALLTDLNRDDLIGWVKDTMSGLAKTREAVIDMVDREREAEIENLEREEDEGDEAYERRKMALRTSGPTEEAKDSLEDHEVEYEEEGQQDAATRHIHLKLLLRLLKWESREADDMSSLIWTIPKTLLPDDLRGFIRIIDDFLINPLDPENRMSLSEMVAKKSKPRQKKKRTNISESESGSDKDDDDEVEFSDPEAAAAIRGSRKKRSSKGKGKGKSKRRSRAINGEDGEGEEGAASQRRKAKRRKEAEEYRTAEFIEDSDVDEEADRAFFEREKRLREQMEKQAGLGNGLVERKTKEKKKKRKKKGQNVDDDVELPSQTQATQMVSDEDEEEAEVEDMQTQQTRAEGSSAASDSEDEPLFATKTRPKARPRARAKASISVAKGGAAGSSERENRQPASSSSSSPAASLKANNSSDNANALKRTRRLFDSSEDEEADTSVKQQATATSRRSRMQVVASDDDDDE